MNQLNKNKSEAKATTHTKRNFACVSFGVFLFRVLGVVLSGVEAEKHLSQPKPLQAS